MGDGDGGGGFFCLGAWEERLVLSRLVDVSELLERWVYGFFVVLELAF